MMLKMDMFILISLSMILSAELTEAGECCKAHIDWTGQEHPEQYCNNYCCYRVADYFCCDNEELHQAAKNMGQVINFCASWFKIYVWVAVLIGIACVAILITLATCCCCCCCGVC